MTLVRRFIVVELAPILIFYADIQRYQATSGWLYSYTCVASYIVIAL